MCLNVILPNLSLAFSSVTFYQIARILLTPTVALMNFILYKATLPRAAILALIPACAGVGLVSYYDSLPAADAAVKTTSPLGVIFAFMGIFASSLYTVWIASYHRKLEMSSMQLLHNQAPISAFLLLYVIPFVDYFPTWSEVPLPRWILIMIVSLSQRRNRPNRTDNPISPACAPLSSIFRNSSSLRRLAQSPARLSDTSRLAPSSRSAGSLRAAPLATSLYLASLSPWAASWPTRTSC
jgi:hypothetical protein